MNRFRPRLLLVLGLGLLCPATSQGQAPRARVQRSRQAVATRGARPPRVKLVGTTTVGDTKLDFLAYDDGSVTATAEGPESFAYSRWHGDSLRAWLDTANALLRYNETPGPDDEVTLSTPIDGIWLVRKISVGGSRYVFTVISPKSAEVVDLTPNDAQLRTLLRMLSRTDSVMRRMTPDSLLRARTAPLETSDASSRSSLSPFVEENTEEPPVSPMHPPANVRVTSTPSVLAQFELNGAGRVVPASFRILSSDDPALDAAARSIVLRTRYAPTTVRRSRATVRVQHRIFFRNSVAALAC